MSRYSDRLDRMSIEELKLEQYKTATIGLVLRWFSIYIMLILIYGELRAIKGLLEALNG